MENFLVYRFSEIVRYGTYKHTLWECTDFTGRYQAVQLGAEGSGRIVTVDTHRLPLLQDFPEPFRQCFGRFTYYLTTEYIAHSWHDNGGLLVTVVTFQLAEVLKAQYNRHLVASCRGNQIVQTFKENRG